MFRVRWIICISRITRVGMKQRIINAAHLRNVAREKFNIQSALIFQEGHVLENTSIL
jgi:hypothetical protein